MGQEAQNVQRTKRSTLRPSRLKTLHSSHRSDARKSSHGQQRGRVRTLQEIKKGGIGKQIVEPTGSILPLDLVAEHIFSRLSVRQLCQLRCVCKAWDFALAAGQHLPDKVKEAWFLMRAANGVRMLTSFSSSEDCCSPFRIPLAGAKLSSYLGGLDWARLGDNSDFPSTHFIASAGGLVCALVKALYFGAVYDLIVSNFFTGSVKVLPRPPSQAETLQSPPLIAVLMAVDNQEPGRYYVMLIDCWIRWGSRDFPRCPFEVFDSKRGSWRVGSSPKAKVLSGLKVALGDFFNCLYHASDGTMDVLAYHVAEDAWSAVQVPLSCNDPRDIYRQFPSRWSNPSFLRYEGRLFMGRLLVKDYPVGFQVWELQLNSSRIATLAEVARTPESLYYAKTLSWTLKGEGCVFYMQPEGLPEGKWAPLVYDLAQKSWYVVPSEQGVECILVHRPRPSMMFR